MELQRHGRHLRQRRLLPLFLPLQGHGDAPEAGHLRDPDADADRQMRVCQIWIGSGD